MIKGNLKYPTFPILTNTASTSAFNAYCDSVDGEYKIVFPSTGMTMGGTGTTRTINLSKTYAGSKQLKEIVLNPLYSGDTLNYETGFDIKVKQRDPGVHNDNFYPQIYHISAKLNSLGTVQAGGVLAIEDILSVKEQLWNSVKLSDTLGDFAVYMSTSETVFSSFAGITGLTIYFTDGTTSVVSNLSTLTLAELNAEANLSTYGYAMLAGANTLRFVFPYQTKCVDKVVTTGEVKTMYTNLAIVSTDPMKQAFVEVGSDLGTVSGFSYAIMNHSAQGCAGVHIEVSRPITDSVTVSGASYTSAAGDNLTISQLVAAIINTGKITANYGYAEVISATKYIVYSPYALLVDIYPMTGATAVKGSIDTLFSGTGIYPRLTGDDIWRTFTNNAHDGEFANLHYVEKPNTSSEYILIHLTNNSVIGGQHQASSYSGNQQEIRAYVNATQFFTKVYEAASGTQVWGTLHLFGTGTSNSICSILEELVDQSKLTASGFTATILDFQAYA